LFRLLKLARNWKSLQNLLRTITSSLPDIANFGALLAIIVFVFSLIGMQVLAGRLQFDSSTKGVQFSTDRDASLEVPRANFDNIYWSTITVFQLLTGEDWNRIMYDGWRVRGSAAVLFVTLVITVGNFVVMNLFLAILLKNFEERNNADKSLKIIDEPLLAKSGIIVKQQSIIRTKCSFMDKDNFFRKICFRIVECWKFDVLVTLLIVVSSICILLDNPLADPRADYVRILHYIEWGVTIFFIFEAVVKILGYGLIAANDSYLRSGWNILDFFLVIVSILNMKNIGPGNVLRPLRTLRVLRPLRMISRFKELKVVVDALLSAIPAVSDVGILCSLTFVIFSCFGVSFLKGTFYRCGVTAPSSFADYEMSIMTYPETINLLSKNERELFRTKHLECEYLWYNEDIPTSKEVCLCLGGAWVPVVPQNFDNVLNGITLLFEISTTEGWVQVMHAAVDQRGVDMEPVRDHSPIWAIFFVIFILICAFFLVELFVGVVLENFSGIRRRSGSGLMTESQRNWARTQTFLLKIKPIRNVVRPSNAIRSSIYDMTYGIGASKFEGFVTCCICLTAMNLSFSSFGDSQMKMNAVNSINAVFTIIFGLEAIFKLGAIGWYYFDDRWNCFDFVVAVLTTVGLFFDEQAVAVTPLRFVRLFRIMRLLKNVEKLRQLFNTLVISIPSVANIGGLILLIFFIYAILGVQLFCFLPEHGDLTEDSNFRSFGNACLLLFRFATGENWNGFMRNMLISIDNCQETQIYDPDLPWCLNENDHPNCTPLLGCGAGISAYLYFYSFVLVVSFVVLNLFVGIVLEAFETSAEGGDLSPRDLDEFIRAWSIFDTKASGFIPAMSMKKLVMELSLPLGIGDRTNYKKAQEVMNHQCLKDLPITKDGKVNIVHAATQLAKRVTIEKVGDEFIDLSDDHPLQRRLKATAKDSDRTLNELYIEKSKKKLRVLRAFARAKIKPEDLFSSSV
jgi:voltage-dependent calcium channel L type alpha-1D